MEKTENTRIIFEDNSLLVVDKEAGVIVNTSQTARRGTLQEWLSHYFNLPPGDLGIGDRAGIVHRLDRDTSGLLVIAKTQEGFANLQSQFKSRQVFKEYLSLVHGELGKTGKIDAPIGRNVKNRYRFDVVAGGRSAKTLWQKVASYRPKDDFFDNLSAKYAPSFKKDYSAFSLIKVHPKTGRTHQIRVHMRYIGHALVADDLYTGRKFYSLDRLWCPRIFLHATQLTFTHPASGKKVTFEAPLPDELKSALDRLVRLEI